MHADHSWGCGYQTLSALADMVSVYPNVVVFFYGRLHITAPYNSTMPFAHLVTFG